MGSRSPEAESVRVAKIGAWQAVVVAMVAGLAGVIGTAGLKYFESSAELKQAREELQQTRQKADAEVAAMRQRVRYLTSQAKAITTLRTGTTQINQEACLEKLSAAIWAVVPEADDGTFQECAYGPGCRVSRGGYQVTLVCEPEKDQMILVVAGVSGTPSNKVDEVAEALLKALR